MRHAVCYFLAAVFLAPPQAFSACCRCERKSHCTEAEVVRHDRMVPTPAHSAHPKIWDCCTHETTTSPPLCACWRTCHRAATQATLWTPPAEDRAEVPPLSIQWTVHPQCQSAMTRRCVGAVQHVLTSRINLRNCVWLV